jgi:hypothetical protein
MITNHDQAHPDKQNGYRRKTVPLQNHIPSVDDLTKAVRQRLDGPSRAAKIYALMDARGEEITP